jgi:integrase/recombinase XerD
MQFEKTGFIEVDLKIWENYFLLEKKLSHSPNTIKAYRNRIDKFIEFCYLERVNSNDEKFSIKDIDRNLINRFLGYLKEEYYIHTKKQISNNTLKTYKDTLHSFFMFISENNDDAVDLTIHLRKIKIKTEIKIKNTFTFDEYERIERALKEKLSEDLIFAKYRNYLMLYILFKTGMRTFEVINLKKENLIKEGEHYRIKILGKGGKERINFIKVDEIKEYFDKYFSKMDDELMMSEYLFPNKEGSAISRFTLYDFNVRFLKKLHIYKFGLHLYRHSFARRMVSKGVNLAIISQWLGHSDISITHKYYARANEEDLKSIA